MRVSDAVECLMRVMAVCICVHIVEGVVPRME